MVYQRMTTAKKAPAKIGSLIDKVMGDLGLASTLAGWNVLKKWPEIVGETIARVTRPVRYEDHIILISVPDAVWRQQLSLQVELILKKIHEIPGGSAVRKIRFIA